MPSALLLGLRLTDRLQKLRTLGGWSADWCGSLRAYMTVLVVVIALPAVPYSTVPFIDYRSIPISRTGPPRVMWLASLASGSEVNRVGPAVRFAYVAYLCSREVSHCTLCCESRTCATWSI